MPRTARKRSTNGYYHVILRGIDRQVLFYEDKDRYKLLDGIRKYSVANNITVLAYTLMNNHVHLLLKSEDNSIWSDNISRFIKQVSSSYVFYYNKRYDRTGHLFQERFHSEPVDTDRYLLTVTRYILQNPAKGGLGATSDYRWSSFGETFHGSIPKAGKRISDASDDNAGGICTPNIIVNIAGGLDKLYTFVLADNNDKCLEYEKRHLIDDDCAVKLINEVLNSSNPRELYALPKEQRDVCIFTLRSKGVTNSQISRITGIGLRTLARIKK